ncbi:dephospho-CoA kinase [Shewanella loihica]|uniref:Dephospho-CoA kinase n=1 Tax=Shewanella loihica (strain ATCC BAA-1088 / PV-4) TaxID=323850 RepID=A3QIK9_SHELP|nr:MULTISPECIES: dephospho-CoA kinase [Shewanella]ABO25307.1 dephospho-CoA kinase [Shewanella loihica PV-4]QYJ93415.1 dephospho-CoA kinase [Shewanella spartinae]
MSKFVVGLTGGIGSGKTTVANLFGELGIDLVDADVVSREVVAKGTKGLTEIAHHFGPSVLLENGELNRAALREKIFNDPSAREWLNNLLHPLIRTEMLTQLQNATSAYAILVVPLLFENGLDRLVNCTLVVDISPELQIKRTTERDAVDAQQVKNIIASQASRDEKLSKADDVIDNRGDISALKEKVAALHNKYIKLAAQT